MVVTVFSGIEVIAENTTAIDEEDLEVRNSGMFDWGIWMSLTAQKKMQTLKKLNPSRMLMRKISTYFMS